MNDPLPPVLISTTELTVCLEKWRALAAYLRDREEKHFIEGSGIMEKVADLGAFGFDTCIEDLEKVIAEARL